MSIYGSRGSTLGSGYGIGSKRPRVMESNPYFAVSGGVDNYLPAYGGAVAFPVVKLRGLPFNCADFDVYRFFSGLEIVDCLLTHRSGRFTGEAFVVFSAPVHAELALQRDRHVMGHRYVEVFRSKKVDYYNAIAAEVGGNAASPPPPPRVRDQQPADVNSAVLKLRGLPFSATRTDVVDFFTDFEISEENVHLALRKDGKATGEAYVEFSSAAEAKMAMMAKHKMTLGSRYVEIFPSSPEEADQARSRSRA